MAVEQGRLPSVDAPVVKYVPELSGVDREITFAHMANQTSCYGVEELPGAAYDYNDWQMALFIDTLFGKVFGLPWERVDADLLGPMLADRIGCQDEPTFLAFGLDDRAGRLAVSPRDFARFGWLFLKEGRWRGEQILSRGAVRRAVGSPLSNSIPRTAGVAAPMLSKQRSLGSLKIPDNQTDHLGSYSWAWWVNGVDRHGRRLWPDAPADTYAALGHKNGKRGLAVIPSLDLVISWNDTTLDTRPETPHPLGEAIRLLTEGLAPQPLPGQIIEHPKNPAWLVRNRDANDDGKLDSFYMCGPGDPEGFLYLGVRQANGTRQGPQQKIIERLARSGANGLYVQAIRSHGGDGDSSHNPFVDSDPGNGIDEDILHQWDHWLSQAGDAGVVFLFFIYDDSASIWKTGDEVGEGERQFLTTLVKRLSHHPNIIWCVAEEYEETFTPARVKKIARIIRSADPHDHVISVHKWHDTDFEEFADDPVIGHYAVQHNVQTADAIHAGLVKLWREAAGRYSINLSECAEYGFGEEARRKHWAAALAGAYTMPIEWTFADPATPSGADLQTCGHVVKFMEETELVGMAPHPELARVGTKYVLAAPGHRYIAYGWDASQPLGIAALPAGRYALTWLAPATGKRAQETLRLREGDAHFQAPSDFSGDVALRAVRLPDHSLEDPGFEY